MELKGSRTEANLQTAFAGESQAHTKYQYYASKAKADGYVQISNIFLDLFFVVYLVMIYGATRNRIYVLLGLFLGAIAGWSAYQLFSHVRTRVIAWMDPFSVIDNAGYQVAQSLFAIGTGGWFGLGLGKGNPTSIPVVVQDFIFSAICEEYAFFGMALLMVLLSSFYIFINVAMRMKHMFYRLIALGLGTLYLSQIFLSVGGNLKFIPSTGVTLPFVSYGGSSLLATFLIFNIIIGLYLHLENEGQVIEKESRKTVFEEEYETFEEES